MNRSGVTSLLGSPCRLRGRASSCEPRVGDCLTEAQIMALIQIWEIWGNSVDIILIFWGELDDVFGPSGARVDYAIIRS